MTPSCHHMPYTLHGLCICHMRSAQLLPYVLHLGLSCPPNVNKNNITLNTYGAQGSLTGNPGPNTNLYERPPFPPLTKLSHTFQLSSFICLGLSPSNTGRECTAFKPPSTAALYGFHLKKHQQVLQFSTYIEQEFVNAGAMYIAYS